MKSNPGEGESCWCQTRVEAEFVDTTAPLSVTRMPSAPGKITGRVVKLRLATRSPPRVRLFTAEGHVVKHILAHVSPECSSYEESVIAVAFKEGIVG